MRKSILTLMVAWLFLPSISHAHMIGSGGSFIAGLNHPVLGFDHLLAMFSVGILSAQMGGRAIWTIPTTFVLLMIVGGFLGMEKIHLMSVETGIAFSVLVLGIALAAEKKLPPLLAMLFVGTFALFHGHAHGMEMPYLAEPVLYASGFVTGTAAIHIAGVLFGVGANKLSLSKPLRFLGAAIAGVGVHLLVT